MNYILMVIGILLLIVGIFQAFGKRFRQRLLAHPTFSAAEEGSSPPLKFEYRMDDPRLQQLREKYDLYTIAGDGSEVSKIINLMRWVHGQSRHAANPTIPDERNALHLLERCQQENFRLNCYLYAIILNEVYLAMGFPSRIVHLLPMEKENKESHFVTSVYSQELERWIMMDPDMRAMAGDEQGNLLGLSEIRRHLVEGRRLSVNRDIGGFVRFLGKWSYPWYLSKNIFRLQSPLVSAFDMESQRTGRTYVDLLPDGFNPEKLAEPHTTPGGNTIIAINDEEIFWQTP